jgi:N-acetylneuraminic acid mutarotase
MAQYNADTDSWIETIIPTEIALSNQAVVVDGSIFFFGGSGRNKETTSLSEYRAFYKTFLPGLFGP